MPTDTPCQPTEPLEDDFEPSQGSESQEDTDGSSTGGGADPYPVPGRSAD